MPAGGRPCHHLPLHSIIERRIAAHQLIIVTATIDLIEIKQYGTLETDRQEDNSSVEPVPESQTQFVCYWSYPRDHGRDTSEQLVTGLNHSTLPSPPRTCS